MPDFGTSFETYDNRMCMCVYIIHIYYDINFKLKIQNNVVNQQQVYRYEV